MSARSIVEGLGGRWQAASREGQCRCPAHDDRSPSLHVSEAPDGTALFHCFAGCSQQAIKLALIAKGLFIEGGQRQPMSKPRPDADYMSPAMEDANRFRKAFEILRAATASGKQPAKYLAARGIEACPSSALLLSASDSSRLLDVGFPAMVLPVVRDDKLVGCHVTWLTKAADAKLAKKAGAVRKAFGPIKGGYIPLGDRKISQPLIVAEGIETALSAMQVSGHAGVAAISAGNMIAVELPDAAEIIIAADNDETGIEAAEKLAKRLATEGREVRKAMLEGEQYDFNDAVRDGNEAEALAAIRAAKAVRKSRRVQAITMEEFMELVFPKKEMMLSPWLETSSLAMVHAFRGGAKTWFCLGVARAVARGEDFMDWRCEHAARVLYVDGEMPGGTLQKRLASLGDMPAGNLHILSREQFALHQQDMPDLGTEEGREVLDKIIESLTPELIILDSESTLVRTGFENDADSWRPLQAWLMKHRWRGRSIIYVVHDGLSGRARGTTKREDAMDSSIGLKLAKEHEEGCTTLELAFDKHRNFFGADAEDRVLTFRVLEDDVVWDMEFERDDRKDKIRKMLDDGFRQKDIAAELNLTEGRVSQIVREMKAADTIKKADGNVLPFRPHD